MTIRHLKIFTAVAECGSMHGWGVPGADPKAYEQNGMKMGGLGRG